MDNQQLLDDRQLEILLRHGPEMDRVEPLLSPELRDTLVALQRNAANRYASGTWHVAATGETLVVNAPSSPSMLQNAQYALGSAYLAVKGQGKAALRSMMELLGLTPSASERGAAGLQR